MIPKLICAAAITLVVAGGCTQIPPNLTIATIQDIEQNPVKSYTDSLTNLGNGTILSIVSVALNDNLKAHFGEDSGQAIIAYAFRSSGVGVVTSLGVMLPSTGYQHTVTLWDSATFQVLAQTVVPTLTGGKWTYVSLALANQAVAIQPNHGYLVGFNSLAVGNAINVPDPGNWIYELTGLFTLQGAGPNLPIFPFTRGEITFEAFGLNFYDDPSIPMPYPLVGLPNAGTLQTAPGLVDIGYIPAP